MSHGFFHTYLLSFCVKKALVGSFKNLGLCVHNVLVYASEMCSIESNNHVHALGWYFYGGWNNSGIEEGNTELKADMQPTHRAEALNVLATIELKFALLWKKLYVGR